MSNIDIHNDSFRAIIEGMEGRIIALEGNGGIESIETAVADCPVGGTIFLKAGNYQLNGTITITKPINIIGEGRNKTIIKTADAIGILAAEVDYITIKNLTIDGDVQEDNNSNRCALVLSNCDYTVLDEIEVKNSGYSGIDNFQSSHSLYQNIYAHDNYRCGFHPGSNTVGKNMYNVYRNIYVWDNGLVGFGDRGCDEGDNIQENCYNTFDNINAWDNEHKGIYIGGQKAGVLSNSFSKNNANAGLEFGWLEDFNISNCYLGFNKTEGIFIEDSNNVNFSNVIVKNNNTSNAKNVGGIKIENVSDIRFTACQSYDNKDIPTQRYGVGLFGTNTKISLLNCKLMPNKDEAIYNPNRAVIKQCPCNIV